MIGYKSKEGIFVTGGSNSNMLALLAALYKNDDNHKFSGKSSQNQEFYATPGIAYLREVKRLKMV